MPVMEGGVDVHTVARYRVREGMEAENAALVRAVYEELHRIEPAGIRYATFQSQDGRDFVHVAVSSGKGPVLSSLESFKRFQEGIRDRCEEGPECRRDARGRLLPPAR